MVVYIIFPEIGLASWQGRHIGASELWAYIHGHAHRHESVWIVPGLAT